MIIRLGCEADLPAFLGLAGQVEQWFGPMVGDAGFHAAVAEHIGEAKALVAEANKTVLGALLFGGEPPTYHLHWMVVSARSRGTGVGRALVAEAIHRYVRPPATLEVITFGPDHPGAITSGARAFYEHLGFTPGEATEPGPEGGSRQVYRLEVG
ncbi:GNAT family N-acetyltransferase [Streptomyces sp. 796.1]|uniref:GNAT family N-acetyltransferase n=1 Tax=Streptomyces sp. 796.1 TaxID=3163029 RepID=UPI0039C9DFA3